MDRFQACIVESRYGFKIVPCRLVTNLNTMGIVYTRRFAEDACEYVTVEKAAKAARTRADETSRRRKFTYRGFGKMASDSLRAISQEKLQGIPLLDKSQEILLARQVQTWLHDENATPRQKKAGQRAYEKLINCNLRDLWCRLRRGFRGGLSGPRCST